MRSYQHKRYAFGTRLQIILLATLISVPFVMALPSPARAVDPLNMITYQGRLLNSNGVPVADAALDFEFRFFDDDVGGTCLWSNSSSDCDANDPGSTVSRSVEFNDGLFTEDLGDTTLADPYGAIPDTVFADNAEVFLEVEIEGETLDPRKRITAAAFALNAQTVDGFDSTELCLTTGVGCPADSLLWTDGAVTTYLTDITSDFGIGATDVLEAPFSVDVSANAVRIGTGATANATLNMFASDGDEGNLIFSTNDRWEFTGGDALFLEDLEVDGNYDLGGTFNCTDCIDWDDIDDTSELDAATSITGAAGETLTISRNLTDGGDENGLTLQVVASDTGSTTTSQFGLRVQNDASTEGLDAMLFLNNTDTDDAVDDALRIGSAAGGITTGLDFDSTSIATDIEFQNDATLHNDTNGDLVFVEGGLTMTLDFDEVASTIQLESASDIDIDGSADGEDAIEINASVGGINILASGAGAGEDIDITATGSSVNVNSTEAVSDAIVLIASDAAGQIFINAGSGVLTDKTADAVRMDLEVNSASVAGIFIDADVGTALSADEAMSGISIDMNGLAGDDAISRVTGITLTSANTSGGSTQGIEMTGTWDTGINLSTGSTTVDIVLDDGLNLSQDSDNDLDFSENSLLWNVDFGEATASTITSTTISNFEIESTANAVNSILIESTSGGIDISASGATSGEDIDITATGSSVNITATEAVGDAIVMSVTDAAGGMDFDAGTGGFDFDVTGAAVIGLDVNMDGVTAGDGFFVSMDGLTSGDAFEIQSTGTFSGNLVSLGGTSAATGDFIEITSTSTTATARAINIDLDNGDNNNDVFVLTTDETANSATAADTVKARITASGEFLSDVGFSAGSATTTYRDGSITTTGTTDLTLTIGGDQLILSDGDVLNIGGLNDVAYNTISNAGGSPGAAAVAADNDLYVQGDLEVDATVQLDGAVTTNGAQTFTSDVDMNFTTSAAATENLDINQTHATDAALNVVDITYTHTAAAETADNYLLSLTNADNAALGDIGPDGFIQLLHQDTTTTIDNGILFVSTGGAITDAFDASDSTVVNALNVGDNTIFGSEGVIDFSDFDVSADGLITLAPDGGGAGITITPSAALAIGLDLNSSNIATDIEFQNGAALSNDTDGDVVLTEGGLTLTLDFDEVASTIQLESASDIDIDGSADGEDAIEINTSAGGINILASGAGAGEDIDITATGSSINIIATENVSNAIVIDADAGASGGIDLFAGTNGVVTTVTGAASTAFDVTANGVTSGNGLQVTTNGLTSGDALSVTTTSSATTAGSSLINLLADITQGGGSVPLNMIDSNFSVTNSTAATTTTVSENVFELEHTLTANDGAGTSAQIDFGSSLNLMTLFTTVTEGAADTVNYDGDILRVDQNFADATGDGIEIQNAGTGRGMFIDQDGNGVAFSIDSEATSANVINVDGTVLTTGDGVSISVDESLTDASGFALFIDYEDANVGAGTAAADRDIVMIQADNGASNDDNVFRIESDGEVFSDVGFTAGEFSTTYADGSLTTTGSTDYLMTIAGGDLTFAQATIIGDNGDQLTLNSNGNLLIDDASVTGSGELTIASTGGGNGLIFNPGSSVVSIDPSGSAILRLVASDGDTGDITYGTNDRWEFTGGNIFHDRSTVAATTPTVAGGEYLGLASTSTFTTNSNGALGGIYFSGVDGQVINQITEGAGTDHHVYGVRGRATNETANGQVTFMMGVYGDASTTSTNATPAATGVAGVHGRGVADTSSATTIVELRGISGEVTSLNSATVTNMYAVRGTVNAGSGAATRAYGALFENTNEGATRFGVVGEASGGATDNLSGFFYSSRVQIDVDSTINTPTTVDGGGDLFVVDQVEAQGANVTTGRMVDFVNGTITSGIGLRVLRSSAGVDFTNTTSGLVTIDNDQTVATSTGNLLFVQNGGVGSSIFVDPNGNTGSTVSDAAGGAVHITNTGNADYGLTVYTNQATSTQPLVYLTNDNAAFDNYVLRLNNDSTVATSTTLKIDQLTAGSAAAALDIDMDGAAFAVEIFNDGNADTRDGINVQGCLDVNPTGACDYLMLRDGDGTILGAIEGNGAGGVTNASAGSDYAELFPGTYADFDSGDVIGIDASGNAALADETTRILGALSVSPNTLGNWINGWESLGTYVPVALLGQVPVNVNDEAGAIVAGDFVTLSSTHGVAMKASGVGFVLGRALESHTSGSGTIKVFVEPSWQAGDILTADGSATLVSGDLVMNATGMADAITTGIDSNVFSLRGSGWDGSASTEVSMNLVNEVTDVSSYRLSIRNTASDEVAYVNAGGDLAIAGRFYPSDRGVLQTDKYIYYDGSSGMGGDFMRTNASGWATGGYDFAEMFPSEEPLESGELVIFASEENEHVKRSNTSYDWNLAGIVSTRPGFLAGDNEDGQYPIALAGRVPTRVTTENGTIEIGDPLTSSSEEGYAMKATEAGPIVGYALEPFTGEEAADDSIIVFVNVSYWAGVPTDETPGTTETASTETPEDSSSFTDLNMEGDVYMNGYDLLGVARLIGISERWSIEEDGTIKTEAVLKTVITSYQNEEVETTAVTAPDVMITLVGTAELENGQAVISFEDVSANFNDIISTTAPIRIVVTPNGPVSLYVSEKDHNGFTVKQVENSDNGITFDWMVSAYRKDYEPEELLEAETEEDASVVESEAEVEVEQETEETVSADETVEPEPESTTEPVATDELAASPNEPSDSTVETEGGENPEPVQTE